MKNITSISVRLRPELAKEVARLAKSLDRTVSWAVRRVLEEGFGLEDIRHTPAFLAKEEATLTRKSKGDFAEEQYESLQGRAVSGNPLAVQMDPEDEAAFVREQSEESEPWIFANYWPNYFGEAAGSARATWLADSAWEASAYIPGIEQSPLEILETVGGWVVLESRYAYSPMFITPASRTAAWQFIQKRYEPAVEILDFAPNFPHFRENENKILIYRVE